MSNKCETCRVLELLAIPLLLLKVSNLYAILCGCHGSPNVKNWMCELCTFSQIRSQIEIFVLISTGGIPSLSLGMASAFLETFPLFHNSTSTQMFQEAGDVVQSSGISGFNCLGKNPGSRPILWLRN